MAIKMDGHTITALQLKASDGSEVTKQLTEEGTIPTPTETLNINTNGERDVTNYKKVNVQVEGGGELPELTNPASASDIAKDKEAIDGSGNKIIGTKSGGGGGLQSFRTTTSGSANIEINTGAHDLTDASIIVVQYVCRSTERTITSPQYAQYMGVINYVTPIIASEIDAGRSATTIQGGTEHIGNVGLSQISARNSGRYFSDKGVNFNWYGTFAITSNTLSVTGLNVGLEPTLTYDVIVHYV